MRFPVTIYFFTFFNFIVFGQNNNAAFQSLDLPISARSAVLNQPLAIFDNYVEMGIANPAMLNSQMEHQLSLNVVDYFADINFLSASYAFPFKSIGTMGVSIKSIGYGEFVETDYTSQSYGIFGANEQIVAVGMGKSLSSNWQIGSGFKAFLSSLENYQSVAVAADLSIAYTNFEKNLYVSLLAKNYGRQLTAYHTINERVPFQLNFGLSKKLEHLPFLFSLGYKNIQQWNLIPKNDNDTIALTNFSRTFFSHLDIGGELTIFKHIQLRVGFNPKRRQQLKLNSYIGMVGFSWGIGIRFTHFNIDYGRSTYHLHGSPNYFSISTDFAKFYSKNEKN